MRKKNKVVAIILVVLFLVGYSICKVYYSKVPRFSYTAEWTASHYFLFIWVIAIVCALFNRTYTALSITAGCFVGIILGDVIGQGIINHNWDKINHLISNGNSISNEMMNQANEHKGVSIWIGTILLSVVIGCILDKRHSLMQ